MRRMNRSIGHPLVWNDSTALQKALDCANARGGSSNGKANSGLSNRVLQQPEMHTNMNMNDLCANSFGFHLIARALNGATRSTKRKESLKSEKTTLVEQ